MMFGIALTLSIMLCTLVSGFLFAWAVVIMPGFRRLDDKDFIRAFQVVDGVIQSNQPLFVFVWLGSVIALIVCAVYGWGVLSGLDIILMALAIFAYLVGVQAVTVKVHLPLNARLQRCNLEEMNDEEIRAARAEFEPRWNQYNQIRTTISCAASLTLIVLAINY